jgi:serine protease AprX
VRATLTKRGTFRLRSWQVGLLAIVFVMALGMIRSGASWGSSSYNPATDPYSLQNVEAGDGVTAMWNAGWTGKGVDVALIDTGVASVPALSGSGKIVNGPDLSLESQNPSFRYIDTNGHGTVMAGIIGGNDGQAGGYRGVAPDSRILSVKVADADGGVDVSQVIAAIDWVVQHRYDNGMNIRVINLSYGTDSNQPYTIDPLAYAVEQAWKAGIVVVAAAGNTGFTAQGMSDPAEDPWILSVGAVDTGGSARMDNDKPTSFSAGPSTCQPGSVNCASPTLVAPGAHIQDLRVPGSYGDPNTTGSPLADLTIRGMLEIWRRNSKAA